MKYLKEIIPYIIIIAVVILIRTFIVTPVIVDGVSMNPTLKNNQVLLLKKYDKKINRFDIVVINYKNSKLVKRVIGLPGEIIKYENNILYINEEKVNEVFLNENVKTNDYEFVGKIPENTYFVVGDNRSNSTDSRIIGPISTEEILGTTSFSLFPLNRFGKVK